MGALTLKVFSNELREWELIEGEALDPTDSFGVGLRLSLRENQIYLAEPNDPDLPWITDKARLFFDGMFTEEDTDKQITAPQPTFAAILLTPLMRSDQSPTLKIPANAGFARLQIVNSDQNVYEKLRLDVIDSNGALVLRREFDGKRKSKVLTINISAEKLANREYEITLSGANADKNFKDLNYYRFSVQKK